MAQVADYTNVPPTTRETFIRTDFVTVSGGAVDAGRPVVLKGTGQLDETLVDYTLARRYALMVS